MILTKIFIIVMLMMIVMKQKIRILIKSNNADKNINSNISNIKNAKNNHMNAAFREMSQSMLDKLLHTVLLQ